LSTPGAPIETNEFERVDDASPSLSRFLFRPIVFRQPDRAVNPPSWLEHVPFAFWLMDVLRPRVLVELGTHSGNSYAAFAQAVQFLGLPTAAYAVDTWRGDSQAGFYDEDVFEDWSQYHDQRFSAFSRLVRSTFDEAAAHFADGSIDLLHLDGCHTYEAASADLRRWRPKLGRTAVILIHDTNVREGDFGTWRVWEELRSDHPTFEFLHGHGLGVVGLGNDLPEPLRWLLGRDLSARDVNDARLFFSRLGAVVSARFAAAELRRELEAGKARMHEAEGAEEDSRAAIARLTDEHARLTAQLAGTEVALAEARAQAENLAAQHAEVVSRLNGELEIVRRQLGETTARLDEREEALQRHIRLAADLYHRGQEGSRRAEGKAHAEGPAASRPATPALPPRLITSSNRLLRRTRRLPATLSAVGLLPAHGHRTSRSAARLLLAPAALRDAHLILSSGLFDERYYRDCNPDVAGSRMTPLSHYLLRGAAEGRNPHPLFDAQFYLQSNPDVASTGINPLVHYLRRGAFEGRSPHPLFDVQYYLLENPDIREQRVEPLTHFLRFGAADGRNPNPYFDCAYYQRHYPDVAGGNINPLVHYICHGWREGRRTSRLFDAGFYCRQNEDVRLAGLEPLAHYLAHGRAEERAAVPPDGATRPEAVPPAPIAPASQVTLKVRSLGPGRAETPTVLCLSHVMPVPPRAGNEYRIYRLLRWLRDQGWRIVPVIAPLPGESVDADALRALADEFSNAVLCDRDGRLDYVLRDVPDALAALGGELTQPVSLLLDEEQTQDERARQLLHMDRTFCHDALITAALRLHQVLGPYVLLAEYIWMSRLLPLIPPGIPKVIDTHDVFSSKHDKVIRFGIEDIHVLAEEEARRLQRADLILAIQEDERQHLQRLVPHVPVVTAGVDVDVLEAPGAPAGRCVLYVGTNNAINRRGLTDFLRFAWPLIRREVPDAELLVAGRVSEILPAAPPGVRLLGKVGDLGPLYRQARVVINPAVAGTGLKIKTLEALAHLRPIVTWPSGTDGLVAQLAARCTIVEDWFGFARKVSELLAAAEPVLFSPADRQTIAGLTSPAVTYAAMTDALQGLWTAKFAPARAGAARSAFTPDRRP
jgi:hypothetical protein